MGQLVRGDWVDERVDAGRDDHGRFVRQQAQFRRWIASDGSTPFAPEAGRYHLYLATACPWCHRTDIVRALKGLQDVVSVSYVDPLMLEGGWRFSEGHEDPLFGYAFAHQLYTRADPGYTGRVTVPVLWDKATDQPVSNESSEILRMFDHGFGALATDTHQLYPEALRAEIDAWNDRIYDTVNNGVYKSGFAHTQAAYEEAFEALFATLDALEAHLAAGRSWLVGDQLTEADVRLFCTLVRFDAVYVGHFKCNRNRIVDMPHLQALLERALALPGVRETVHMDEIRRHYYGSHRSLNPKGIVPVGPALPWLR
jgi:putative glutathione S-transferase